MKTIIKIIFLFIFSITLISCKDENKKEKVNEEVKQSLENKKDKLGIKNKYIALKLLPVDEASKDSSFYHFREELKNAVNRKDAKIILENLDSNVILDYGGGFGKKIFIEDWKPFNPNSKLWAELNQILSLGGNFMDYEGKHGFLAPYVFSDFPNSLQESEEVIDYMVVIDKNVKVFKKPDVSSEVITKLNYDIVKASKYDESPESWVITTLNNGKTMGFIEANNVRNYSDMHIFFEKKNRKWIITEFLGGI